MRSYTPRIIDDELDELLAALPAVALEGAKGVGKTATAERRVTSIFRLDTPAQRQLFESLVTLSVRVYAQAAEARVRHLREHDGRHEIDLIVERADQKVLALEVKLAASVEDHDVRHLLWLRERLGDDLLDAVVISTGTHAYRRPDGIAVVPAALLTA